jgi:hypothetical protein
LIRNGPGIFEFDVMESVLFFDLLGLVEVGLLAVRGEVGVVKGLS